MTKGFLGRLDAVEERFKHRDDVCPIAFLIVRRGHIEDDEKRQVEEFVKLHDNTEGISFMCFPFDEKNNEGYENFIKRMREDPFAKSAFCDWWMK